MTLKKKILYVLAFILANNTPQFVLSMDGGASAAARSNNHSYYITAPKNIMDDLLSELAELKGRYDRPIHSEHTDKNIRICELADEDAMDDDPQADLAVFIKQLNPKRTDLITRDLKSFVKIIFLNSSSVALPPNLTKYKYKLFSEDQFRNESERLFTRSIGRNYAAKVIEEHREKTTCYETSLFTLSTCFFLSCLSQGLPTNTDSSATNAKHEAINQSIPLVVPCCPEYKDKPPGRYICGCTGPDGMHCCYCERYRRPGHTHVSAKTAALVGAKFSTPSSLRMKKD